MNVFKGTKGKWAVRKDALTVVENEQMFVVTETDYPNTSIEEQHANALLISKAPEMLEMLQDVLSLQKENYGNGINTHLKLSAKAKEIEDLIKSATEHQ